MLLVADVAEANRCRTVWSSGLGSVTVIGLDADQQATETIFTSLLVQATAAMTAEGRWVSANGQSRTRAFRQSFLTAYAHRIGARLREVTDEATASAEAGDPEDPDGILPVLNRGRMPVPRCRRGVSSCACSPSAPARWTRGSVSLPTARDQATRRVVRRRRLVRRVTGRRPELTCSAANARWGRTAAVWVDGAQSSWWPLQSPHRGPGPSKRTGHLPAVRGSLRGRTSAHGPARDRPRQRDDVRRLRTAGRQGAACARRGGCRRRVRPARRGHRAWVGSSRPRPPRGRHPSGGVRAGRTAMVHA